MKDIYIYICQGLIAALFTTIQRRQLTVTSNYHAICWCGSSLAAVGALLCSPSDARATRGDTAQLLRWRYVAQPDLWRWLHTAHGVRAINYLARNRGGKYINTLWARANPYMASEGSKRHGPHDIRRWLGCSFSHLPPTPISAAGLLWRLRRLTSVSPS